MAATMDMINEAVTQLLRECTPSAQGGMRIVVYGAVEQAILDQIRKAVPVKTNYKPGNKIFEASKATGTFC